MGLNSKVGAQAAGRARREVFVRSTREVYCSMCEAFTDDSQLGVGVFDAPVILGDALVHPRVVLRQTGKLQLSFAVLRKQSQPV